MLAAERLGEPGRLERLAEEEVGADALAAPGGRGGGHRGDADEHRVGEALAEPGDELHPALAGEEHVDPRNVERTRLLDEGLRLLGAAHRDGAIAPERD